MSRCRRDFDEVLALQDCGVLVGLHLFGQSGFDKIFVERLSFPSVSSVERMSSSASPDL